MNKLIALGESHHGTHLEEIKTFFEKEKNIDGLFVELSISCQKSVNKYLKNKKVDEKISRYFEGAMREGKDVKDTLLFLLDFAIEKNIRVICVDSSKIQTDKYNTKSLHGNYFIHGESRDEDMFNNIIEHTGNEERWIIFCGAMHLINEIHHRTKKKTLGFRLKEKFNNNFSSVILK